MAFLTFTEKRFCCSDIEEVKPPHIKAYFQHLKQKNLAPTYINGILKCLRAFFKYVAGEGYININPTQKVNWLKEGKVVINTFSDDEVKALINSFTTNSYLEIRNKLILAVAFDTGVRNTEICELTTSSVRGNAILIHGKGNKERFVPVTPYLKKLMMKYERYRMKYFEDKDLKYDNYFLSRTGRPLTKEAIERVFNKANEKANVRESIRCSPHTARHYYAQANLRNGLDVYSLSRLLGHETINITKRYLQSIQDENILLLGEKTCPLKDLKLR